MLNENEKILDELGYMPIESLEDLGDNFKWWKSFRTNVIKEWGSCKIWYKLWESDDGYETFLSTLILDLNGNVLDYFVRPNGLYAFRSGDLDVVKMILDDLESVFGKDDIVC